MSWLIITIVNLWSWNVLQIRLRMEFRMMGSSPVVGSSKRMISGSITMARASATRRTIPPLSSSGNFPPASSSPTFRRMTWTRSRICASPSFVFSRRGNATFSNTSRESNSAPDWKSMPNLLRVS